MGACTLSGEDFRLMGGEMGASYFRRQARKVSKVVRPLTHQVLNVASVLPVSSSLVSSARKVGDATAYAKRFLGRQASSILKNVEVPENILQNVKTPTKIYVGAGLLALGLGTVVFFASRPSRQKA